MELYTAGDLGIDVLAEVSVGVYTAHLLDTSGFYIDYRPDGSTPVNVINGFAWIDDKERKTIVRRADYTDYQHQVPLPVITYDILSDTAEPIEMGTNEKRKVYNLSFLVAAENKAQVVNLANFIATMLEEKEIPVLNYNVDAMPKIGVITSDDVYTTRYFDVFVETNLAKNYSIAVTASAVLEFNNSFER